MNITLNAAEITITGNLDSDAAVALSRFLDPLNKFKFELKSISNENNEDADEYKYPQAKRFSNMAKLAQQLADDIENHNGHISSDEAIHNMYMLSKLIDYLSDSGHFTLKSIKVVQGLSISEIMRLSNGDHGDQL